MIYQKIESRPPDPLVEKEEITDQVKRIENEVAAGEKAEPAKVERWLRNLAAMAPDILDVTVAAITNPAAGIYLAIRKIAQKVKEEVRWAERIFPQSNVLQRVQVLSYRKGGILLWSHHQIQITNKIYSVIRWVGIKSSAGILQGALLRLVRAQASSTIRSNAP